MDCKGKTVLLTGGSAGIGAATARELAKRRARLILVARRKAELIALADELEAEYGCEVATVAADLTQGPKRRQILEAVRSFAPHGIDILIHNAGMTAHGRFEQSSTEMIRLTFELNFFAVSELTRYLLPSLREASARNGAALLVLVSTPSGYYGIPERAAYSASKAAANSLMETLHQELRNDSISTLIFAPGYTRTGLRQSGGGSAASSREQAPNAKSPEEVAKKLIHAIESGKRRAFTDKNGRAVWWLRTLAPSLLENLIGSHVKRR